MAAAQCISRLGAWEGYVVDADEEVRHGGVSWCRIWLRPRLRKWRCCSGCRQQVAAIHDIQMRRVRELPIFETPVELMVPRLRLLCPRCGPKLEHLPWLEPYSRTTVRLETNVARMCKVMSVRHAAAFYEIAWTTAKRIDKRYLERELGPVDLEGVRVIAMDEFAIHKGHRTPPSSSSRTASACSGSASGEDVKTYDRSSNCWASVAASNFRLWPWT